MTKETILFTALDWATGSAKFQANLYAEINKALAAYDGDLMLHLTDVMKAAKNASDITTAEIKAWEVEQYKKSEHSKAATS